MGKKKLLIKLLNKLGLLKLTRFITYKTSNPINILAYHRVLDINENFMFDKELVSASVAEFDAQIKYISENFVPITFSELNHYIDENIEPPNKSIIITFDDGFMDNYVNAFPILKKYSVPACFFVSTEYIGSDNLFWFDRLYYMLNRMPPTKLETLFKDLQFKKPANKNKCFQKVLNQLKHKKNEDRISFLEHVESLHVNDTNEIIDPLNYPMNWEVLKDMLDNGMEIESHTVSHPILTSLTDTEIMNELADSKLAIEKHINNSVSVIAYPAGNDYAFDNNIIQKCKESDYKLGASYIAGRNYLSTLDRYSLKRLHIESYHNIEVFKAKLSFPRLFDNV